MEIVDVYNDDYSLAGAIPRDQAQKEGRWVKVSHLWIINPKSASVIFQKRSKRKKNFPEMLDITTAGHYSTGEELSQGTKEMSNELGVDIAYDDLISLGVRHNIIPTPELTVRQFCHVFFMASDYQLTDYSLNPENSEGLTTISIDEGLRLWSEETSSIEAFFIEATTKEEKVISLFKNNFLPRVDPYYFKIFILAKRFLMGEKHLVI